MDGEGEEEEEEEKEMGGCWIERFPPMDMREVEGRKWRSGSDGLR